MTQLKLDLLENAIDSFNEALSYYEDAESGNDKAYKFCIQNLCHFFELILKYYVTQAHPLLIFKNPFAKKLDENSFTIGLQEAINFLKNEGSDLPEGFEEDLQWLKKLRNNIEHHKFEMNTDTAKEAIGRLVHAIVLFDEDHENIDLEGHIKNNNSDVFHVLAKTYEGRLLQAYAEVENARKEAFSGYRQKEFHLVEFDAYACDECGHETVVPNDKSPTGYLCTFCGCEESEYAMYECFLCGSSWPNLDLSEIDWADDGNMGKYCPVCLRHPDYVKDD